MKVPKIFHAEELVRMSERGDTLVSGPDWSRVPGGARALQGLGNLCVGWDNNGTCDQQLRVYRLMHRGEPVAYTSCLPAFNGNTFVLVGFQPQPGPDRGELLRAFLHELRPIMTHAEYVAFVTSRFEDWKAMQEFTRGHLVPGQESLFGQLVVLAKRIATAYGLKVHPQNVLRLKDSHEGIGGAPPPFEPTDAHGEHWYNVTGRGASSMICVGLYY